MNNRPFKLFATFIFALAIGGQIFCGLTPEQAKDISEKYFGLAHKLEEAKINFALTKLPFTGLPYTSPIYSTPAKVFLDPSDAKYTNSGLLLDGIITDSATSDECKGNAEELKKARDKDDPTLWVEFCVQKHASDFKKCDAFKAFDTFDLKNAHKEFPGEFVGRSAALICATHNNASKSLHLKILEKMLTKHFEDGIVGEAKALLKDQASDTSSKTNPEKNKSPELAFAGHGARWTLAILSASSLLVGSYDFFAGTKIDPDLSPEERKKATRNVRLRRMAGLGLGSAFAIALGAAFLKGKG